MLSTQKLGKSARPVTMSVLVAMALACAAPQAVAGFTGAATAMQATGPCLFSEQLQKSVSVRRRYLVQLSEALGTAVPVSNTVEDMYGNITPASYRDESDTKLDLWGFETNQKRASLSIDPLSTGCLGCHDGAAAVAVTANLRNDPYRRPHGQSGPDHPIGMEYRAYAGAGRGFKAIFEGSNKMVFVDGKVGCLTCHDPMNPAKGHLVMSDRRSALCLTCHDK